MRMAQIARAWDEFFFKPSSTLPFCVFRILYGLLMLQLFLLQLAPDWQFWYGPQSPINPDAAARWFWYQPVFDLFTLFGNTVQGSEVVFALCVISTLFLTIGFATRYSAIVLFMCMVSLHCHDPWNINGGDCFLRLTAFFLALGHPGEMLSVDSWLRRRFFPQATPRNFWPWAQRLFQIQVALVYWQTSMAKLSGTQWIDGSAVWYATRLEDLMRLPIPYLFDNILICKLLTWSALGIEVALWTLIWIKELRYWVLVAGLLLHLGIDATISLPLFEWAFIASYITFISPEDLSTFFTRTKSLLHRTPTPQPDMLPAGLNSTQQP